MNNRELFHATMRGENGGQLLFLEQGFNISHKKWVQQGMPEHVLNCDYPLLKETEDLFDHTNVCGYLLHLNNSFCMPPFEEKVLEKKDDRVTILSGNGAIRQWRTDSVPGSTCGSLPHEIDFTIKDPKSYHENRFRLIGSIEERYNAINAAWLNEKRDLYRSQQDHVVPLGIYGPFAYLRDLMGVENAMVLPFTEPEMIKLMLRDYLDTTMALSEYIIKDLKPDLCFVWEDCCGSTGPFITPGIFEEMMAPWYREWKSYLLSMGVEWLMLDTDGDPSPLVKLWYESGVDCMQPWEVNAVDMLKFAEEYPQYTMMGGIYKHIFEPGDPSQVGRFKSDDVYQAIDDELERVVKHMRKRGRYIASLDHWAFWGVTYDGYRYFQQQLEEKYGKANKGRFFR